MKAKGWKILGFIVIVIFALSAAKMVSAAKVTSTITVGTLPTGIAYDSAMGEIFVANHGDNTVSAISDSTNTIVATIPVGTTPEFVAYDSAKS